MFNGTGSGPFKGDKRSGAAIIGRQFARPHLCFAMILSTHAVVGGAIASLGPSDPILAAAAGFASYFAIDAIPHWDYPLRSISEVGQSADAIQFGLGPAMSPEQN